MQTDSKSIELRVTAILKSVIESGAPMDEWPARTKYGVQTLLEIAAAHEAKIRQVERDRIAAEAGSVVR